MEDRKNGEANRTAGRNETAHPFLVASLEFGNDCMEAQQ